MYKPKTQKVVTLEGKFPELLMKNMYQKGRGRGGSLKVAAVNAMRDLLKSPALRGRRLTCATITMSIGTVDVVPERVESDRTDGIGDY